MKYMAKRSASFFLAYFLIFLGFAGCGGGGDGSANPVGGETTATTIGPGGGIAASSDGKVVVSVPQGALSQQTDITVDQAINPPSGNIGVAYEFGPDGTTFSQPVTISITYDETSLSQDVNEGDLRLGTVENNQWVVIADSTVDVAANKVTGTTTHFSVFGVIAVNNVTSFTLTVIKVGTGSGSVTSLPAGIDCGATCSALYYSGTSVTLTATPDASSIFSGWSGGGCTGTGSCSVVMGADTTVTTAFTSSRAESLDTTFGTDGKVTTYFGLNDSINALAIQADGKIVAAGYSLSTSGDDDFALARYNTDGSLDTTFGTDGKVTTDFGLNDSDDTASAVVIQTDGKIVAVGYAGLWFNPFTDSDFALARYNTDGSLDTTFGTDGKVTTDFGLNNLRDEARAVSLQTDGKIVAAGYSSSTSGDDDFALARYYTDGSLDTTFGTDGMVTTDIGISTSDFATALAVQADGKIVAAGGSNSDFALVRYNPDGTLDTTFGTDGKVTTDIAAYDSINALAVQADGKIVAAGSADMAPFFLPPDDDFALARYLP